MALILSNTESNLRAAAFYAEQANRASEALRSPYLTAAEVNAWRRVEAINAERVDHHMALAAN